MSLQLFEENEKLFTKQMEDFERQYKQFSISSKKQILIEQIKLGLNTANQQMKFMDIECGQSNPSQQANLAPRVRKAKQDYTDAKKKLAELERSLQEILAKSNVLSVDTSQKQTEVSGQLINQTYQLQDANAQGQQTLNVAQGISENLKKQKQMLLDSIEDTKDLRTDLSRTNRQVGMMRNREMLNKGILLSLVFVLGIGDMMIIFYKFFK